MGERFSVAVVTDWQGVAGPAICNALVQAGFSVFINGPQEVLFHIHPSVSIRLNSPIFISADSDEEDLHTCIPHHHPLLEIHALVLAAHNGLTLMQGYELMDIVTS